MTIRVYKSANGGLILTKPGSIYQGGEFIEVQNFEFGGALVTDNVVSVDVDGTTITQNFDTDSETTITALAAQIAAHPHVRSAANIGDYIIHIETKYPGQALLLENYSVTGGDSQVSITVSTLSPRELDFNDVTFDDWTSGLDYVDLDDEDVPTSDQTSGLYHERWYFDGTPSLENLVEDTGWDSQLKPFALIRKEYLERIRTAYDAELDGVAATGSITYGSPLDDDACIVDGHTFTKVSASPGADEFTNISELTALIHALTSVNATDNGTVITVTAAETGTAGNSITLSRTGSSLTPSDSTLSGGEDPDPVELARFQRALDKVKENDEMGHTADLYESTRRTAVTDEYLDEFSLFWYQKDLENLDAGVDRPAYRTKLEAKIAEIEAAIAGRP